MLAAGCGGGQGAKESPSGQPAGSEQPSNQPAKKDPITLVFYNAGSNFNAEGYFEEKFGSYIRAKFPHITPEFIPTTAGSLDKLIVAGEQVDVIWGSVGTSYNSVFLNNLVYDIEPYVKKYKVDLNRFEPRALEMMRQMSDGKLYALPFDNQAAVVYYNKDLFDKFGVPYPTNVKTWDDLYDLSVKLTRNEGGVQYYGLTLSPNHYFLRNQLSVNLVDPATHKVNLNNDQVKVLLENVLRFYRIPGFDPKSVNVSVQKNLFLKDKVAAMWTPISGLHVENDLKDLNWDIIPVPPMKEAPGLAPQPYATYVYLSVTSKHKDDAFQVIDYLTSEEFLIEKAKQATFLPALNSAKVMAAFGQDAPMYKGKNVQAIPMSNMAAPSPQSKYFSWATAEVGVNAINAIILEGKDINTALREAEEAVTKRIAEDKAK